MRGGGGGGIATRGDHPKSVHVCYQRVAPIHANSVQYKGGCAGLCSCKQRFPRIAVNVYCILLLRPFGRAWQVWCQMNQLLTAPSRQQR